MVVNGQLKILYVPENLNADSVIDTIDKLNKFVLSNDTSIIISFSHTKSANPSGLTILLCYLRNLPKIKPGFKGFIIHSNDEKTDNLIARMGFYNQLGLSDDFDWNKDDIKLFKELYCFNKTTNENEIIDINEKIIYSFTKLSDNDNYKKALSWCIPEIVDNARTHSDSDECVLFAQKYSRGDYTEFCIADCGVGIQQTMGDAEEEKALIRCISQAKGIHSKGMGNGLFYTSELIKNDKSRKKSYLSIISGNTVLKIESGNTVPEIEKVKPYWQGTVVTLTLSDDIQSSIEKIKGSEVELSDDLPNFYC